MAVRDAESEVPGDGAGEISFAPATEVGVPTGETTGSTPAPILNPQLLTGGAETRQAEGRSKALVMFNVTPNCAAFLNASHKHSTSVFSTFFSPAQQFPSGFFALASPLTYDRQSAMSRIMVEQSVAGAGAVAAEETSAANQTAAVREKRIVMVVLVAIFLGHWGRR